MAEIDDKNKSESSFLYEDKKQPKKEIKVKSLKKIVLVGNGFIVISENGTNRRINMDTKDFTLKKDDLFETDL